jgi:phosphate transport system protein
MTVVRKAFHEELQDLDRDVIALGVMAAEAIDKGTAAFLAGDIGRVDELIERDHSIDDLMASIEMRVCGLLARQQPMAGDLRRLVAVLRIIHDLERCGDYMVNIMKAARRLYPAGVDAPLRPLIERMRAQAVLQVQSACEAFATADVSLAGALADMDDVMDDLQKELLRTIFTSSPDEEGLQQAVQVALVGRYFERIADHAVNVAERVIFMVEGHAVDAHGGGDDGRSDGDPA